jgi:ribosome maturation protein SDO1
MTDFISKEKVRLNLARLRKSGHVFEVDVDPEYAMKYKNGDVTDIREVLKAERVFSDAKKGELASDKLLEDVFGTSDPLHVADVIIREGEIQVTAEQRAQEREQKKRRIIDIIQRNAIDPTTRLPHPAERIKRAMEEAKVRIDDALSAEDQVQSVVDKLKIVLPIRFEEKTLTITIPAQYTGKLYAVVKKYAKVAKEDWNADGSWTAQVSVPAGLQEEFIDRLNSETHGSVDIAVE